jgi:hypothetical protein
MGSIMPTLRYWDKPTSTWKYAATDSDVFGLVPVSGGTISGPLPLVVDAKDAAYALTVDGTIIAEKFTTTKAGVLNVGILIFPSAGRVIDFGGAKVQEVADSAEGNSVVTKQKVDAYTTSRDVEMIVLDGARWIPGEDIYPRPWVQVDREGRVSLEGYVRSAATVDPADDEVIGTIPEGYRPRNRVVLPMLSPPGHVLVEVLPNGDVVYREGSQFPAGRMISLSGSFYAAGGTS